MMEGIYGIEFMEYIAKPSPYPYAKLLRVTGARGEDSLFCEDSRNNCCPRRTGDVHRVGGREREGVSGARRRERRVRPAGRALRFPPHSRWNGGAARGASGNGRPGKREERRKTEGKPKRSYWRRGPRKKKGAEDAAGTAAATPPVTEEGVRRREARRLGRRKGGDVRARPPARSSGKEYSSTRRRPKLDGASEAPGNGGRSARPERPLERADDDRGSGKKKPGDAPAQASPEGAGETPAPAAGTRPSGTWGVGCTSAACEKTLRGPGGGTPTFRDVGWGGQAELEGGETSPAPARPPRDAPRYLARSRENPGRGVAAGAGRRRGKGKDRRKGGRRRGPAAAADDEEPETDEMEPWPGRYGRRRNGRRGSGAEPST